MNPRLLLAAFLLLLSPLAAPTAPAAAAPKGDVYLLGIALDQAGSPGGWARVGPAGAWKQTLAGAVLDGRLYTVESSGVLYVTNLDTGAWKDVGKPEFANTRFMFASAGRLYTVETSGSLYRVDPADGSWALVGADGAFAAMTAGAVLHGQLFEVEKDGGLYAADLTTGERRRVGKPPLASARWMAAAGEKLYVVDSSGDLHRVDPADAAAERVGPAGAWESTNAVAVLDGQLFSTERGGGLCRTDLRAGRREALGKSEFANTRFMFASAGLAYTIETDGSLYRVTVKPNMDDYDWCPQEMEKALREQGATLHRNLEVRQVLGARATHAEILKGFAWLRERAKADDLAIVYVDAHGSTDPKQGWGIMTADGKTLWGREVKAELSKLPCQAMAFVETCTSGGFARAHGGDDPPLPANVTALCACQANQTTNNQLDLAVSEALYGRADFNHDGVVDVDELTRYVRLRYAEWWPAPRHADDGQTPVIEQSRGLAGTTPLTKVSPALSAVAVGDDLWSAVLEEQSGGRYRVHLLGWSSRPGEPYFVTDSVTRDAICLPGDGPPLRVERQGHRLPARLVGRGEGKLTVHYLGRDQEESVGPERVRYPFAGRGG